MTADAGPVASSNSEASVAFMNVVSCINILEEVHLEGDISVDLYYLLKTLPRRLQRKTFIDNIRFSTLPGPEELVKCTVCNTYVPYMINYRTHNCENFNTRL